MKVTRCPYYSLLFLSQNYRSSRGELARSKWLLLPIADLLYPGKTVGCPESVISDQQNVGTDDSEYEVSSLYYLFSLTVTAQIKR